MDDQEWLTQRFEADRGRLRAVAYRMLGSLSDADDAVQEAWLRLARSDAGGIENLTAWLTTVIGRVCLDMIRSRAGRREEPLGEQPSLPDPVVSRVDGLDPEQEAVLADSVGLALLVVLQTLSPAERLAFVLHDMFGVPFDEIGVIIERSPSAAKMLASRARQRLRGSAPSPDPDIERQRQVVDAFFAAARRGDFADLVAILDPDVLLRADGGTARPEATAVIRGAAEVAGRAVMFAQPTARVHPALVNGAAGVVIIAGGQPVSVMSFTVSGGRIVAIDGLVDPDRLSRLDLPAFD